MAAWAVTAGSATHARRVNTVRALRLFASLCGNGNSQQIARIGTVACSAVFQSLL
jgi:hypothetical protein